MTVDYSQGAPQPPRSWWSRNWGWVVAIGCLTPLLLLGGCVAGLVFIVFAAIKNTDIYTDAMARAQRNPEVQRRLGQPIEAKWWIAGNINTSGDEGEADFRVPIKGPKGSGTIHVEGTKDDGRWNYQELFVEIDGQRINLLEDASPPESTDTGSPTG